MPRNPRRLLPFLLVPLALALGPPAASASETRAGIEAEGLLVQDKIIAGVSGYFFFNEIIGVDLGFSLMFLDEDNPRDPVDGVFLGGLVTAYLVFGLPFGDQFMARFGTGLDYYALWGIDDEEGKAAMPLLAEARFYINDGLSVFVQPRYYLFSSDGLEPGVSVDGEESMPFVIAVGVGGEWR